ncbi:hypothetical protein AAC387_Pa08g1593 [Persea americana]
MESPEFKQDSTSDPFFDALHTFLPLDLPNSAPEFEELLPQSQIPQLNSFQNRPDDENESNLRHRSSTRFIRRKISTRDSILDSSAVSDISEESNAVSPNERRIKILSSLKDQDKVRENSESPSCFRTNPDRISPQEDRNCEGVEQSVVADPRLGCLDRNSSNFLVWVARLVIKAIRFQMGLFISFITFPFWVMHCGYRVVTSPFQALKRARNRLYDKFFRICNLLLATVSLPLSQLLNGSHSVRKFMVMICWGCLCSMYVFCVLFSVFVSAFIAGWIAMSYFVEEPVRMKEVLNFDYTKVNPAAVVPIISYDGVSYGLGRCLEKIEIGKRVIPANHQLQVAVSLILPESEYNRKIGVFQVRVEFLSSDGNVSSASSQPCMLRFTSLPIHFLETLLKSGPLLLGYSSESQILNLKMTGFREGTKPTACLRVILEQRAELKPGAGIPEIYSASLSLKSELPLFKRIISNWRKDDIYMDQHVVFHDGIIIHSGLL